MFLSGFTKTWNDEIKSIEGIKSGTVGNDTISRYAMLLRTSVVVFGDQSNKLMMCND
jgi:hypothetical protein